MHMIIVLTTKQVKRKEEHYCRFLASQSASRGDPHSKRTYRPSLRQGIRSSLGVRARVRFRIQDSGTRQRVANSPESISSACTFPPAWDTNGTSAVLKSMFSIP
jgi:hypothetical protein